MEDCHTDLIEVNHPEPADVKALLGKKKNLAQSGGCQILHIPSVQQNRLIRCRIQLSHLLVEQSSGGRFQSSDDHQPHHFSIVLKPFFNFHMISFPLCNCSAPHEFSQNQHGEFPHRTIFEGTSFVLR